MGGGGRGHYAAKAIVGEPPGVERTGVFLIFIFSLEIPAAWHWCIYLG